MMRALWPWLLGGLVLFGCDGAPTASSGGTSESLTPRQVTSEPDFGLSTPLALIGEAAHVRVGEQPEDGWQAFPAPNEAEEFKDLPPGFNGDYRARGWDTPHESFGMILYGERIALAMHQLERVDEERLQEQLAIYRNRYSDIKVNTVEGARVRYWFWEVRRQRLMICAVQTLHDGLNLTFTLGDTAVMDPLRMDFESAQNDRRSAETIFRDQLMKEPPKSSGKTPAETPNPELKSDVPKPSETNEPAQSAEL